MDNWVSINIGDSVIHLHTGQLRSSTTYIINISDDTLSNDSKPGPIPSQAYVINGIAGLGLHRDLVQQGKQWVTKTHQVQYKPNISTETSAHKSFDHVAGHPALTAQFEVEGAVSLNFLYYYNF